MCGYIDLAKQQLSYSVKNVIAENTQLQAKVDKLLGKLRRCKEKKATYKQKYKDLHTRVKSKNRQRSQSRTEASFTGTQ